MNTMPNSMSRLKGVSLIELMIALAIGTLLLLGLVQVFAASRSAYQLSEGLSRVQENGRFAIDYLQRDIRMAGHMGCVNDQARFQSTPVGLKSLFVAPVDNFAAGDFRLRFDVAVQAYNANGTAPGNTVNLAAPVAGWTPALPGLIAGLGALPGSDVIVLRYFSPEGVPVTNVVPGATGTISFDFLRADVLRRGGVANPGLFGVSDCINATVFQANAATDLAAGTISVGPGGLNASDFAGERYVPGQATVYRAESAVLYIANNVAGNPALFRTRFTTVPGGAWTTQTEELVEGIENMQLLYGQDRQLNPALSPSGFIDTFDTANGLTPVGTPEETWRRVGVIKLGLLARSPDRAAAGASLVAPRALGVNFTVPPNDGRFRAVYESSIAMRNRLYGN